jgi:hypothetical protein
MSKTMKIKVERVMPRNHLAIVARQRRAGTMHDRRAPRGGTRNEQAEYLALADEEDFDDWDW